jgi:hypothetical protein
MTVGWTVHHRSKNYTYNAPKKKVKKRDFHMKFVRSLEACQLHAPFVLSLLLLDCTILLYPDTSHPLGGGACIED